MSERACVDDRFRILIHKSSKLVSSCVRSVLADRFGIFCVAQEAVEQRRAAAAMEEQQRAEAAEAKVVAKREAAVRLASAAAADLLQRVCATCCLTVLRMRIFRVSV